MNVVKVRLSQNEQFWEVISNDIVVGIFTALDVSRGEDRGLQLAKARAFDVYCHFAQYGVDVKIIP